MFPQVPSQTARRRASLSPRTLPGVRCGRWVGHVAGALLVIVAASGCEIGADEEVSNLGVMSDETNLPTGPHTGRPFAGVYDAGSFGSGSPGFYAAVDGGPWDSAASDSAASDSAASDSAASDSAASDSAVTGSATIDSATIDSAVSGGAASDGGVADGGVADGGVADTLEFAASGQDAGVGQNAADGSARSWLDDATSAPGEGGTARSDLPAPFAFNKDCVACSMACSDDNACTFDALTMAGACMHISYAPQCKIAQKCGPQTPCDGEYCVGRALSCSDGDPCTADACDPALGLCANVAIPGCAGTACAQTTDCLATEFCTMTGRCAPVIPPFQPLGPVRTKMPGVTRVMTYNTYYGFSFKKKGYNPMRRDHAATWFNGMKLDVLALQELVGFTSASLAKAAKTWGHNYVAIAPKGQFRIGLTASQPLKDCKFHDNQLAMGMLTCRIANVVYAVVHLHPTQLLKRKEEVLVVGAFVAAQLKAGRDVIVLGDLNSVSPFDQVVYAVESPFAWFASHAPFAQPPGALDSTVLMTLTVFGLADLQAMFQAGGLVRPTMLSPNPPWGVRVDFMMGSSNIAKKTLDCWVADAPQRRVWSDHLPVVLDYLSP